MIGDSPPPGYVPNSGYRSGGASDPNCPACFASFDRARPSSVLRASFRRGVARVRVRLARVRRCFLAVVAVDRQRYDLVVVARDRTLKADFFAGALALVRRATTAVSILRDGRRASAPRRRARR